MSRHRAVSGADPYPPPSEGVGTSSARQKDAQQLYYLLQQATSKQQPSPLLLLYPPCTPSHWPLLCHGAEACCSRCPLPACLLGGSGHRPSSRGSRRNSRPVESTTPCGIGVSAHPWLGLNFPCSFPVRGLRGRWQDSQAGCVAAATCAMGGHCCGRWFGGELSTACGVGGGLAEAHNVLTAFISCLYSY